MEPLKRHLGLATLLVAAMALAACGPSSPPATMAPAPSSNVPTSAPATVAATQPPTTAGPLPSGLRPSPGPPAPGHIGLVAITTTDSVGPGDQPGPPRTTFAASASVVYVVVSVSNAQFHDQVAYLRFVNGHYIDTATTLLVRPNIRDVAFSWRPKPGKQMVPGTYTLRIYLNQRYSGTATFTVLP